VDVWTLEDLGGLQHLPAHLHSLGLGATKSRRFSLGLLTRFPHLQTLFVEGHSKDIEAIGHLAALEDLTLRSITLPDLRALLPLRRLQSLDIKLGGTKDLRLLPEVGRLRYLELWMCGACPISILWAPSQPCSISSCRRCDRWSASHRSARRLPCDGSTSKH
jgi:hypothetical protein